MFFGGRFSDMCMGCGSQKDATKKIIEHITKVKSSLGSHLWRKLCIKLKNISGFF